MEISVEHDIRTGKTQVVSTATVTPESAQERGVKVYDDGRKSVYAFHPDGHKIHSGAAGMTPTEVEELLRQATDKKVPSELHYHQPVYSAPYIGTSRPSTPRTPRQTPTPSCSPFQTKISSRNESQFLRGESQFSQELEGQKTQCKSPSPGFFQQDTMAKDGAQRWATETKSHSPNQAMPHSPPFGVRNLRDLTNGFTDMSSPSPAALVSVKARAEGMLTPIQPVYVSADSHSPSLVCNSQDAASADCLRYSPFYPESTASLNLIDNLPEDLETEPVTMIFMGFQNAEDEEEDIQAELVIIGNSDDDVEEEDIKNENREESLSYHPEGYKSKIFQPKVSVAKVTSCRDFIEDTNCDDILPHKPTFIHKPGKCSPCLQGRGMDESTSTSSINLEEMKLCTTGR